MSLPQIAQLEFPASEIAQQTTSRTVHRTFKWDYETGDFVLKDGKLVEVSGIEYVEEWVKKALNTVKDSLIYTGTGYGSEHYSLIGKNFHPDFSRAEYERMLSEALMINDAITQVTNFAFSQEGERLIIEFEVGSIYGTTREAVTV